jgi:hypothetical protein
VTQFDLFAAPAYIQKGDSLIPRDRRGNARPTVEQSRALRDRGMQQAIDHAGAEWRELAYAFLIDFIATHSGFKSEDVSEASKLSGLPQPPTDRAWGSLYARAARAGLIEKNGTDVSERRHNSICIRWRTL